MSDVLGKYFSDYDSFHRHPKNKLTHYFGIPMIVVGLFGLLSQISYLGVNGAHVLLVVGIVFYLRLSLVLGLPFSVLNLGLYWISTELTWPVNAALFLVGWIFQGVGHAVYEKKSPAFLKNLSHLLVGPLWIFAKFWPWPRVQ